MSDLLASLPRPSTHTVPSRAHPSGPAFARLARAVAPSAGPLHVLLISDGPTCRADVFRVLPPPHTVRCLGIEEALACIARHRGAASEAEQDEITELTTTDVVLVEWHVANAAVLATLAQGLDGALPILTLHWDEAPPSALPLLVGAFAALPLPLDPLLLEAKVLVFKRLRRSFVGAAADPIEDDRAETEVLLEAGEDTLSHGPIAIDLGVYEVRVGDTVLDLPPRQFALLRYLVSHAGRLVTRDALLEHVWEIGFEVNTNVVDVYVHYLRKKLREAGLENVIETIRGVGFRLAIRPEVSPAA